MPDDQRFPSLYVMRGELLTSLRYGENPHQSAALYRTNAPRTGVLTAVQLQGKELSYNNILDADGAFECVAEFDHRTTRACVIVKHQTPCGVAIGVDIHDAFCRARDCDPQAAFGGVVALNQTLTAALAEEIITGFVEVIICPAVDDSALALLKSKPLTRVLATGDVPDPSAYSHTIRTVAGGFIVQTRDNILLQGEPKIVTKRLPTQQEINDLHFAWLVAKHVKSNAIVYAKDQTTVGIGGGQVSRVGAARIGAMNAEELAARAEPDRSPAIGSVAASDAFFPFADGVETIIRAGATAIIQPGGSKRDQEVIDAADKAGIAMLITGTRHFRH